MIPRKLIFVLMLLAGCIMPALGLSAETRGINVSPADTTQIEKIGRFHALIIGINKYKEWRPLQTAVKDANAVRETLIRRYGFKAEHIIHRTDNQATRLGIIRDLRRLAAGLGNSDNLLIYYAGHGQLDDLTGDGYWIPVEGRLKDPVTWISHSTIKNILSSERVKAKNVVVIADSCYSGQLLRGGPSLLSLSDAGYRQKLITLAARRSRQVITSGGLEPVADGGRDGHSLFAYYLIKALNENQHDLIDLENLFHNKVWQPVTEIGGQRPNTGRLKTPMDEDGQFVLVSNSRQPTAPEKTAPRPPAVSSATTANMNSQSDILFWQSIKDSENPKLYKAYLNKFPAGTFAELARYKIDDYTGALSPAVETKKQPAEKIIQAAIPDTSEKEKKSSPKTKPAIVKSSNIDSPLKLAILPWNFKKADMREKQFLQNTIKALGNELKSNDRFRPLYSYYAENPDLGLKKIPESALPAGGVGKLWIGNIKPDIDQAVQVGRQLKVDAVLMMSVTRSADYNLSGILYIAQYIIHIADKKTYTKSEPFYTRTFASEIKPFIEKAFAEYAVQTHMVGTESKPPKTTRKEIDAGNKIKLAILPWYFETGVRKSQYLQNTTNALGDQLKSSGVFRPIYSYYGANPDLGLKKIPDSVLSTDVASKLWTGSIEPDIDQAVRIGRQLKVDAVLMISVTHSVDYNITGTEDTTQYIIHVTDKKIYKRSEPLYHRTFDREIKTFIKEAFAEYADQNHMADTGPMPPPSARKAIDAGKKIKLAVFPWKFIETYPSYGYKERYINMMGRMLANMEEVIVTYSYYNLGKEFQNSSNAANIMNEESAKLLWHRNQPLADKEPNLDAVCRLGKQIGVDAVLMCSIKIIGSGHLRKIFLIDVDQKKIQAEEGRAYFDKTAKDMIEDYAKNSGRLSQAD